MENINGKLESLSKRAAEMKADVSKRHTPNERDLAKSKENAELMQYAQIQTIRPEKGGA